MRENFDPSTIQDEALRQVFMDLMNLVENLSTKVQEQAEEIQRLRDENNRLKGEQGKPASSQTNRLLFSPRKRNARRVQTPSQSQEAGPGED